MAGDQGIPAATGDVQLKIVEFAAALRTIHNDLGTRIDDKVSAGIWVGPNAPTDTQSYVGWVKFTATDVDYFVNAGSPESPIWSSVLRTIKRPTSLGIPFKTDERIGDRVVWAVDLAIGALPNNTTKLIQIPGTIRSTWEGLPYHWIDTSNSWAYDASSGLMIPLPHVTVYERDAGLFRDGITRSIILYLNGNNIVVQTESDRSNLTGVVRLRYLKAL